ncbi:serine/threonine protein kinase [Neobacillus drentensis]|nr:serine/threonine protein kinase [Neobacillus drentensis]
MVLSVDIGGFDIKRKLYSNEFGLSVFEVVEKETGKTFILRLADFSNKSMDFKKAQWNQLQGEYRTVISDYSHLPHIEQLAKVDEDHLFILLESEEGLTLLEKGSLESDEVKQLIAAVRHLHEKGIIHGSISAENIWITSNGRVILYGAGEAKILEGKPRLGVVSDIRQLIKIIRMHSDISESAGEMLAIENPTTVEELEGLLANANQKIAIRDDNRLATFFERKSIGQKQEADNKRKKKLSAQQGETRKSRNRQIILGGVVGLVLLFLVVYFLI